MTVQASFTRRCGCGQVEKLGKDDAPHQGAPNPSPSAAGESCAAASNARSLRSRNSMRSATPPIPEDSVAELQGTSVEHPASNGLDHRYSHQPSHDH